MRHSLLQFLYAITLGLIGAAIVHIAIILLVPDDASETLWKRVEALGPAESFHRLEGANWAKRRDPLMRSAACRFDLTNGPVHISAVGKVPFWSLAIYNHVGDITFSLNDQVSPTTDLLIVSPLQKILLEQSIPQQLEQSVLITQSVNEAIAVLRVFEPDATWQDETGEFLKSAECMSVSIEN
ncbi:hypothetical protein [Ochrobactrum sp. SFR4]|uniref:DUF1254 domain-containing protein n=1 Tax=Ochrobactrum sp. SFR4 TaxID=2717368 RepID=UPI001C8B81AB|nr:hypothetical protein [Ochrobactrum sp. SFR4]MBX8824544.1 hypothetical protein [Ochrobactrum sp. SFR4]